MRLGLLRYLVLCFIPLALTGCGGGSGIFAGIIPPVLTGTSASSIAPGATLTITGTNLDSTFTFVNFVSNNGLGGTTTAEASSGSTTSVSVTVPSGLAAGTYSVNAYNNDGVDGATSTSNALSITIT